MKFNWGTGIVIAIVLFMAFILQYVIKVQINPDYDNELVTENYYQEEIEVDGEYDRELNSKGVKNAVQLIPAEDGLHIQFSDEFDYNDIKGTIFLYRPSNQKLDFEIPISLSSSNLLIPNKDLVDGRWNITVEWVYNGKGYRYAEYLNLK
ncbi:FixH family protein [Flavobacterium sp. NKUCC04_CG]|uniref:FixH family protein n=1 Tax=Flavobacterium sp. NKUCC04_CG TaxID=2842121 RepID=UPI001C5BBC8C|nr:FixH family protein [Flavobacterium sp. NKUCC04_CG]MBW3519472.1 FixH family protein [Flavobacterium sp. NKUCC04_CG]